MAAGWDESELVTRAVSGDCDAFASLCERYRARVWRIISGIANGPDVEDLAQEAILKAFTSIHSYRREAPFGAWLCRIALNAAHDYRRSAWRRRVAVNALLPDRIDTSSPLPNDEAVRRETLVRVRREVALLPGHLRSAIWLHYFEQFTIQEVAALERVPESTIRSRLRTGLLRLSKALSYLIDLSEPDLSRPSRCEI